jgi:hypothetical protein
VECEPDSSYPVTVAIFWKREDAIEFARGLRRR